MTDREKLADLIEDILDFLDWDSAYDTADYLLESGVTFAKDNNVPSWIPVTERLPEEHESAIPALGTISKTVLVTFWDRTSDKPFPQNCFVRESYTRNGLFFNRHYNGDLTAIAWKEMPLPYNPKEAE